MSVPVGTGDEVSPIDDPVAQQASVTKTRTYFISGVMGGSNKKLDGVSDLLSQDYRARISRVIHSVDSHARVVDPLETVAAGAKEKGLSIDQLLSGDSSMIRGAFENVVALASQCDVVISNLPEASMGSAVELWEAKKKGRIVLTVTPMVGNWLIRSVSDHIFADLDDLEANLSSHIPGYHEGLSKAHDDFDVAEEAAVPKHEKTQYGRGASQQKTQNHSHPQHRWQHHHVSTDDLGGLVPAPSLYDLDDERTGQTEANGEVFRPSTPNSCDAHPGQPAGTEQDTEREHGNPENSNPENDNRQSDHQHDHAERRSVHS